MPLFGNRKEKNKDKTVLNSPQTTLAPSDVTGNYTENSAIKEQRVRQIQEEHLAHQIAKQLSFTAQLAHGSPCVKIGNFTNVKELYQRIADGLNVPLTDILYCTLNTAKTDMEKLLGGQIGLEDVIYAHCKGALKTVIVQKDSDSLGLTITDNGNGLAFIKRIREDSTASHYSNINIGDHICLIGDKEMVGCRHFEVAKVLREIPLGTTFGLKLQEPKKGGFAAIAPRQTKGSSSKNSDIVGSGRATLRLRSKGTAVVEEPLSWEIKAISKIDDLLEMFIGIRDAELANTLIDLGKNLENPSDYALAVDDKLGDFAFPDEIVFDIWGAIHDAKSGRI